MENEPSRVTSAAISAGSRSQRGGTPLKVDLCLECHFGSKNSGGAPTRGDTILMLSSSSRNDLGKNDCTSHRGVYRFGTGYCNCFFAFFFNTTVPQGAREKAGCSPLKEKLHVAQYGGGNGFSVCNLYTLLECIGIIH